MFAIVYIAAIVAANMSAYYFGPAITPVNSFLLIGLDLSLRDKLHERWADDNVHIRMAVLIFAGSLVSYCLNPGAGQIAAASCVAFALSAFSDHAVYSLARRKRFLVKSNVSNLAGAIVDSIVFPTLAFGVLMPEIIALQLSAKIAGGFLWSLAIYKYQHMSRAGTP